LNWARFSQSADAQQQQLDMQRQAMMQRQQQVAPQQAPPPPTPSWNEVDPQGTTIYHPQGDPMPANMQGGGRGGSTGVQQGMGAQVGGGNSYGPVNQYGAYQTPQQRTWLAQIDQMEQGGQLETTEAARWRMMVQAGKDPFSSPTLGEQERLKGVGKADPNSLSSKQSTEEQLRGSEQTAKLEEQDYQRQRQAIHDQITFLQHRADSLKDNPSQAAPVIAQIDKLLQQLQANATNSGKRTVTPDTIHKIIDQALNGKTNDAGDDGAPVQLKGNTITNVGTAAPAKKFGGPSIAPAIDETKGGGGKPVTPDVMQRFLQLAGQNVQQAKALAQKAGFDPNNVIQSPVSLSGNKITN
jgi:hypothetical protein